MKNENNYLFIPPEDLGKGTIIDFDIVETPEDAYNDYARVFLNEMRKKNSENKQMVAILPVGPTEVYSRIVRIVNLENISLKNLIVINMDEYCNEDGSDFIEYESNFSFRRFMDENFYEKLKPELAVRTENRIFPDPKNPSLTTKMIEDLGGADICPGSLGYTGHIAFNDPPEPDEEMSIDDFKNLPTRVINLSRESIVQNSLKIGGNADIIPRKAITLGMKEILLTKKIYLYFMRDWQSAILRKFMHGPITTKVPGSLLQKHPFIKVIASKNATVIPR